MGVVMINCPSTGRAVSTEIETSTVAELPTVIATTFCSACGCVHEWTKDDAWLAKGGAYYRTLADGSAGSVKSARAPRGALVQ
ncbi:MAG: hypothetical protein QOI12_509 [Alphaproteobacteria bacterium]|jgi:hypothetical protein|nr:hypothetical protein [Alphaproteobacteria bacterium]